ncbi:MAG TPA: helix-turn-helix domain-containing protein [Yinghuangia sp.]|uniref:TetR/AcrR family transcriptional regulator n=1 Tax=Yinghuangia sp. YIM S10712 TaxID=3436930 RepID=UPI002C705610|nr:helix-turn-helix domain-containing protein [Yinghuangia sp.]
MSSAAPQRPKRADARRNRDRLVDAARAVYAEQGLDAPLELIARRAGVGNATLYRHFANREALLKAVYSAPFEKLSRRAEELAADPSAADGMAVWLGEIVVYGAGSRGLTAALGSTLHERGDDVSWSREAMLTAAARLLDKAQRARTIRPDVTAPQVLLLAKAIAFAAESRPDPSGQARELLALVMDGLRPEAGAGVAGDAVP